MESIEVWTDGSTKYLFDKETKKEREDMGRPGGWAYLIKYTDVSGERRRLSDYGGSFGTTHNQMELMAILQAIKAINDIEDRMTDHIILRSDSEWAIKCLTGVYNCKKRGVIGAYFDEIGWAIGPLEIKYEHIYGHTGEEGNEFVNALAQTAVEELIRDV